MVFLAFPPGYVLKLHGSYTRTYCISDIVKDIGGDPVSLAKICYFPFILDEYALIFFHFVCLLLGKAACLAGLFH